MIALKRNDTLYQQIATYFETEIREGRLRPGVKLPRVRITVVRRSDSSGTSFIFTNYLSKISKEWADRVGCGPAVNWPVGIGGQKNPGVCNNVARINGAIGYTEYTYAVEAKLSMVSLKNKAGKFVEPKPETFRASGAHADWKNAPGFYMLLTDQPGDDSWPITGLTYILVQRNQPDAKKAAALLNYFIEEHLKDGYEFILPPHQLNYACGYGAGQFPKFSDEVYWLDLDEDRHRNRFMLPTAETALVNMYAGEIIEYGTVEDIFDPSKPHHPYTVGLFHSVPRLDDEAERLKPIPGLMPDPTDLPDGCKFHPRCPQCMERCKQESSVIYQERTHQICCHLMEGNMSPRPQQTDDSTPEQEV